MGFFDNLLQDSATVDELKKTHKEVKIWMKVMMVATVVTSVLTIGTVYFLSKMVPKKRK
jgi:hypothetical protein